MTLADCQLVILAGGLATRLGALSAACPKSMIKVIDRPFLEHQINLAALQGIRNILLLTGHLANQIEDHFGDGAYYGVSLSYSRESKPLGTGGALKLAYRSLSDSFLLLYGDAYLEIDYARLWQEFKGSDRKAMMTVYRNSNKWGKSNVDYRQGRIVDFAINPDRDYKYIDFGISALKKEILDLIPPDQCYSLNEVYAELASSGQLFGYEVFERFFEIGTPEGLANLKEHLGEKKDK